MTDLPGLMWTDMNTVLGWRGANRWGCHSFYFMSLKPKQSPARLLRPLPQKPGWLLLETLSVKRSGTHTCSAMLLTPDLHFPSAYVHFRDVRCEEGQERLVLVNNQIQEVCEYKCFSSLICREEQLNSLGKCTWLTVIFTNIETHGQC